MKKLATLAALALLCTADADAGLRLEWGTPYPAADSGYWVPVILSDPAGLSYGVHGITPPFTVPYANLRLYDGLRTNLNPYPSGPLCAPFLPGNYWSDAAVCLQYDEFPTFRPDQYVVSATGGFNPDGCGPGAGPTGPLYTLFSIKVHGSGRLGWIVPSVRLYGCNVDLRPEVEVSGEYVTIPPPDPGPPSGDPDEGGCCHEDPVTVTREDARPQAKPRTGTTWGRVKSIWR